MKPKLLALLLLAWVLLSFAAYGVWTHGAEHRDFYPPWAGARLLLFEGRDLYDLDTVHAIQLTLYGREIPPGFDQQGFAYPAHLVPLLLPFWCIPDAAVAAAAWEGLSVLLLVGALDRLRRCAGAPAGTLLLLAWFYPLVMLFNGQLTPIPFTCLALALAAWETRRDFAAGALLAVGTVKPELTLLPILAFTALALHRRRFGLVAGLLVTGGLLLGVSIVLAGWWVPDWIGAVLRYREYAATAWAPQTVWDLHPFALLLGDAGVTLMLADLRKTPALWPAASIPLGMLLLPQTLIWNLTLALVPLVIVWQTGARSRALAVFTWLLGWAALAAHLTGFLGGFWRLQSAVIPFLALASVAVAAGERAPVEVAQRAASQPANTVS